MLTIQNPANGRQTDYSRAQLVTEARHIARHAANSDGRLRAWSLRIVEGRAVQLRVDYLTHDGQSITTYQSL